MLQKEDFMVIQTLAQRGLYLCDIAKQVGVHPRTVRRALARVRLRLHDRVDEAADWIRTGPTSIDC